MHVHKSPFLSVFEPNQRLEVPLFQRPYVWDEEQQWQPFWEDIERKFSEALQARANAPQHFLGAMVLDQQQTTRNHIVVRQIIDGQQRITTIQLFLAAMRDYCREQDCPDLAESCRKFLENDAALGESSDDRFKVWPTQNDRKQFCDVVSAGSRDRVSELYPELPYINGKRPPPLPKMVQAYLFFYDCLEHFFGETVSDDRESDDNSMEANLRKCLQALETAMMVVVIDLEHGDDPQVIFETLNARGSALLPADLLKNYIFLRLGREISDVDEFYREHWARFDDEFWREPVRQGRLLRPRSDLFMQHFLASRQGQDIPVTHLYVEYRHWIETARPFASVKEEVATVARQGDNFRRIVAPERGDPVSPLAKFLERFDMRAAYPLLLALLDCELGDEAWKQCARLIESYLVRRTVCNLSTKNYNRIFLMLTRHVRKHGASAERIRQSFLEASGESARWPDDAEFRNALLTLPVFQLLATPKLTHLLVRLNQTFPATEPDAAPMTAWPEIEHILPEAWIAQWPLRDGSKGLDMSDGDDAADFEYRMEETRLRNAILHTLGNLTILATPLTAAETAAKWSVKRRRLAQRPCLPLNQGLGDVTDWDEERIIQRGRDLADRAMRVWPR